MELTQLIYFCAVAKNLHITNTAKELHIAQPALTQSIKRLEKELGVPLFASSGRNIKLTEYGKFVYKKINPFIEMIGNLETEIEELSKKENNTIRINLSAASYLTTQAIIDYKKQNEHIHFRIYQDDDLRDYDVTISTKPYYHSAPNELNNTYICTEKLFLAVPNSSKYATKNSINLVEIKNEDFITLGTATSLGLICDNYCGLAGFKPNIIFQSDNPTSVKNCIAANMGIGFWPQFSWGFLDSSDVTLLPIKTPVCQRDIIISYNSNKTDNSHVIDFYNFLIEYFETKRFEH